MTLAAILMCTASMKAQRTNVTEKDIVGVWTLEWMQYDGENILVLRNAFEKTRKQMKVNALSINALSDNLNFQMFAKLTLKKT